jgi:hypothetical protein
MSVIFSLAIFCAAATQGDAAPPVKSADTAAKKPTASTRTGRELEQAAHAALRRWAQTAKKDLQPAGREYLALYKDLQRDTVLAKSIRQELLGKLRFRLAAVAKKLQIQIAADRRTADKRQPADRDAPPDSINPGPQGAPLGQQAGPAGGGVAGGGIAGSGAVGGRARDAGEDLVDLIESTISPSTWARNGGPGDIYYWRPGLALVVAAPQGVHEDVGNLVGQVH